MCMLFLYWKLYLHIRLYPFQYCSSLKSVNFTTLGPYWSARIRSDLVAAHVWLISAGAPDVAGQAVWEAPELRQNARNVKGHILDKSSRTDLIHAVGPSPHCFFWVLQSWLLCCHCYCLVVFRGLPNQAHSFVFYVPFCKSFSWLIALNNLCSFLHLFFPVFCFVPPPLNHPFNPTPSSSQFLLILLILVVFVLEIFLCLTQAVC